MKRWTKILLLAVFSAVLFGSVFYLSACSDKTSADASEVIAAIDELPSVEEISLTDRRAVQDARSDYNALKNADKEQVTNLDKLAALEEQIKTLLAIDGLTISLESESAMLVSETYTPEITGYAYNDIETTVVFEIKDAGETGAVLSNGTITATGSGVFTLGATVTYKNCNITKTFEGDVEVGVTVTGTVSYAAGLNAGDDYTGVTVTIGSYTVDVDSDGSFSSVARYGEVEVSVESDLYVAESKTVTVSEGNTDLGNFELAMYKVENAAGRGFLGYDFENNTYRTSIRGQFNAVFSGLKVPAGEEFMFSIEIAETNGESGQRYGATFNGIGLLLFTADNYSRFQYFNPVTSYTDADNAHTDSLDPSGGTFVTSPRPMKLIYYRVKDGDTFRWFTAIEVDGNFYIAEVDTAGSGAKLGGKATMATLDAEEISIGVGGPDLDDGQTTSWKNPTLVIGKDAVADLTYSALVNLVKDDGDTESTAVVSKPDFVYGDEVTLTITPKAAADGVVYGITEAKMNGQDILTELHNDQAGNYTYTINSKAEYPDNKITFDIKIEALASNPKPVINGPAKAAFTADGKAHSVKFNITGFGQVEVTAASNDGAADYVSWNSANGSLDIAEGLPKGTYSVTITADNGSTDGVATHTLAIYVDTPYMDDSLEADELGVFDTEEYLQNAANDKSWNDFPVTAELVDDAKANDGKALKVTSVKEANNYVIVYFARQDVLRSQVKSVSVRLRGENLNPAGQNAIWIRYGENPQQVYPAATFVSGEYVTITIDNLAVLNAMATDGYMTKMFIHFAGPNKTGTPAIYVDEITFAGGLYTDDSLEGTNDLIDFNADSLANVVNAGHWNSNIFAVSSEIYDDSANGNDSVLKVTQTVKEHGFVQIYFSQSGVLRENVASVQITLRGVNVTGVNVRTTEANNVKYTEANDAEGYVTITVEDAAALNNMASNGVMTALGLHFTGTDAELYISDISFTPVSAAE